MAISPVSDKAHNPAARRRAKAILKKLKATDTYARLKNQADRVLDKYEKSAIRSQQITEDDLAVRINAR